MSATVCRALRATNASDVSRETESGQDEGFGTMGGLARMTMSWVGSELVAMFRGSRRAPRHAARSTARHPPTPTWFSLGPGPGPRSRSPARSPLAAAPAHVHCKYRVLERPLSSIGVIGVVLSRLGAGGFTHGA